jgi:hypothetical protein
MIFKTLLSLTLILMAGCSTMRGLKQRIKVASNPQGAEVIEGGVVIGRTPAFVEVDRRKSHTLRFRLNGKSEQVIRLEGHYRWNDSFWANFGWLPFGYFGTPVGWATDLITGAAWTYTPIDVVTFGEKMALPSRPKVIAIAPPRGSLEIRSDEIAERWEAYLKETHPESKVLPFQTTYPVFESYNYNHRVNVNEFFKDNLYHELQATHIFESEFAEKDGSVLTTGQLLDIYTEQRGKSVSKVIPSKGLPGSASFVGAKTLFSLLSLIPNTATYDLASSSPSISFIYPGASQPVRSSHHDDFSSAKLFNNAGLRNLKHSKMMTSIRFSPVRLVPKVGYNTYRITFHSPDLPEMEGVNFHWSSLKVGLGPEVGVESPIGYFYLQLLPSYGHHWINWRSNGENSISHGQSFWEVEIGYSLFISERFNLRVFTASSPAPLNIWDQAINDTSNRGVVVTDAYQLQSGLSIGYYFPEIKYEAKRTLRERASSP